MRCPFSGESIAMILRHADVREAAADTETFSSNAPFRVPIPSEESVRTVRQLPIETDPPLHTAYRKLTDPFFARPKRPEIIATVERMVKQTVDDCVAMGRCDAMADLALPIQSRALTTLLNMPESEADVWIGWGIHVFKVSGGEFKTGNLLEDYLHEQFDRGEREPQGEDFFSVLSRAEVMGRRLTRQECVGFANLAFAGGRDTIIHTLTSITDYLADHRETLAYLKEDPRRATLASEEFFRVFMPLTQIGRVCPFGATVGQNSVQPGSRVGLCWSSANFDAEVFEAPHEIRLDRRPNPHVAFGFRKHLCQGAAHARLVTRVFLNEMASRFVSVERIEAKPLVEREQAFERMVGFDSLRVRFHSAD